MGKQSNKSTGRMGEDLAAELLEKKGYEILERNWGSKWGEIDIITKDKEVFVFIEVKTKMGEEFGSPEEMFGFRKREQVQRMANTYFPALNFAKRVDMVAVVLDRNSKVMRIDHYQAVY